jgi:hypothetical protein
MYLSSYIEVFKGMRDGKEENRQIYTGFTGKT